MLKLWRGICVHFKLIKPDGSETPFCPFTKEDSKEEEEEEEDVEEGNDDSGEVYEVEKIIGIRYGELKKEKKKKSTKKEEKKLLFKVLTTNLKFSAKDI